MSSDTKSLGTAIDEIVAALEGLSEAARLTAIRAACDHLAIPFAGRAGSPGGDAEAVTPIESGVPASTAGAPPRAIDVRSLKEQKKPGSAVEMAALVAYYLQHLAPASERKPHISAADVDKYFVQADFPLPKRSDQLLVNARAAGYFDSPTRGAYRLNPVGHNLVAHSLPRTARASGKTKRPKPKSSSGEEFGAARGIRCSDSRRAQQCSTTSENSSEAFWHSKNRSAN